MSINISFVFHVTSTCPSFIGPFVTPPRLVDRRLHPPCGYRDQTPRQQHILKGLIQDRFKRIHAHCHENFPSDVAPPRSYTCTMCLNILLP